MYSFSLHAQQRTLDGSIKIAKEKAHLQSAEYVCLNKKHQSIGMRINKCPFYVFNDTINNRYAIISGNIHMKPLLGYGDGRFSYQNIPEGLSEILQTYSDTYYYLQDLSENLSVITNDTYEIANQIKVDPILTTVWGQDIPFNNNTPRISQYTRTATGCVATAMAQIMNHYHYPDKGQGAFSYTSTSQGFLLSEDFSQTTFDWSNMQDSYIGNFTPEEGAAVATLMKSCGVSLGMDYNTASGAYTCDVPYALIHNFGYNPNVQHYLKEYFSDEEWESIIMDELHNGRPMLYSAIGSSQDSGHAFILDGADGNGLYHFNWGWEGYLDGYFAIDALTPGSYNFQLEHSMVCHIQPENTGVPEDFFCAGSFCASQTDANTTDVLNFSLNSCICFANSTSHAQNVDGEWNFTIGLFDGSGKLIQTGNIESKSAKAQDYVGSLWLSILPDLNLINTDSTYYLKPIVSKKDSSVYSNIRTLGGESNYYKLTVKDNNFSLNDKLERLFTENDIKYEINDNEALTITVNSGKYSGAIEIPNRVIHNNVEYTTTAIANRAFMQCDQLQEITLPQTLKTVGSWAFDGCYNLQKVICYAETPPSCEYYLTYPFDDVAKSAVLYVPIGCKDDYSNAPGWSAFTDVRELSETTNEISINNNEKESRVFSITGASFGKMKLFEMSSKHPSGIYIVNGKKIINY